MAGKIANTAGAGAMPVEAMAGTVLSYVDEEQDSLIGEGKMTRGEQALYGRCWWWCHWRRGNRCRC